jgi:hypothetical protein
MIYNNVIIRNNAPQTLQGYLNSRSVFRGLLRNLAMALL